VGIDCSMSPPSTKTLDAPTNAMQILDFSPSQTNDSHRQFSSHELYLIDLMQKYIRLRMRCLAGEGMNRGREPDASTTTSLACDDVVPSSAGSVDFVARKISGDSQSPKDIEKILTPVLSGTPTTPANSQSPAENFSNSPLSSTPSTGSGSSGGMFCRRRTVHSRPSSKPIPTRRIRKRALTIETAGGGQASNTQAPIINRETRKCFENGGFAITRDGVIRFPEHLIPHIQKKNVYREARQKMTTSACRLDEFKSVRVLGEGRSSRVSLVRDEQTGCDFARKTIFLSHEIPDYMVSRELTAMILCFSNPHIIKFVDAFYDGFCVHIITEYIEGVVLSNLKKLDENVARAIIFQALLAMEAIHRNRILHMDIKLGNMILTPEGVVILYDFGLSLHLPKDEEHFDKKFSSDGTLAYMSPEKMQNHSFCFASDIWSLGVASLKLVADYLPLTSMDQYYASMDNIMTLPNQLEDILENQNSSSALFEFMRDCLRVNPRDRPTATELLQYPWFSGIDEKHAALILREYSQEKRTTPK